MANDTRPTLPGSMTFRRSASALLRETGDGSAVLVDPATGECFQINSSGLLIWNCLAEAITVSQIRERIETVMKNDPGLTGAMAGLDGYVLSLAKNGLVQEVSVLANAG